MIQEFLGFLQHQIDRFGNKEQNGYNDSDYIFAGALLSSLYDLDVTEQNELVQKAFSLDILDTSMIDLQDFENRHPRRAKNFKELKKEIKATVHDTMEWWACFRPEKPSFNLPLSHDLGFQLKTKRQKVGRNDPCP